MESAEFKVSRSIILRALIVRILLTVPALYLLYQFIATMITAQSSFDGETIMIVALFGIAILILWFSYFRLFNTVSIEGSQLLVRSSLHTIRMEIYELITIRSTRGGRSLRLETGEKAIEIPTLITQKERLLDLIRANNSGIEIILPE